MLNHFWYCVMGILIGILGCVCGSMDVSVCMHTHTCPCVSLCVYFIHQQLITMPKFHLAPGAMTQLLKWRENNELIWMHLFAQDALYFCISSDLLSEQMWFWLAESWLISGHASSSACRRLFLWGFIKSWISPFTAVRRVGSGLGVWAPWLPARLLWLISFSMRSYGWRKKHGVVEKRHEKSTFSFSWRRKV